MRAEFVASDLSMFLCESRWDVYYIRRVTYSLKIRFEVAVVVMSETVTSFESFDENNLNFGIIVRNSKYVCLRFT